MIPEAEISLRLGRLVRRLNQEGLDAALFVYAVDIYYFTGTRQNGALWVPANGSPTLLVRKSYERARSESLVVDVRPFPSSKDLPAFFGPIHRRIGMTYDVMTAQHHAFFSNAIGDHTVADISAINRELRSVKSPWEIGQMRECGKKLAGVFREVPALLRPGMSELDLAAEFEYRLRLAGIGGFLRIRGFNQEITGIVVAGPGAAAAGCFDGPITGRGFWRAAPYGPSMEVIRESSPIVIDYGAFFNGYITDMTRVFVMGSMDPGLERAFRVALQIQDWIMQHLRPGTVCEDVYHGALRIADDAGLAENFMGHPGENAKFVGHGVGLELDELPVLAPRFRTVLEPGHVIAVEPKFLFPEIGAVGIENTFVVHEGSCERLTVLPDDIIRV